jgi:hypothetical protein
MGECNLFRRRRDAGYRNDLRQLYVNNVAYSVGSGLGTAPWYGVPGAGNDFTNTGSFAAGGYSAGGYGGSGY